MAGNTRQKVAILVLCVIALCGACSRSPDVKTVGVATLMSHPALDALQNSMVEEMAREGFVEGKNIKYVNRNANGQQQLAATIANDLAGQSLDAIVAITTPMAQ